MKDMKNRLLVILLTVCLSPKVYAVTKTAVATGTWATSGTWSPAGTPAATDSVVIPSGYTVTVGAAASIAAVDVQTGGALTISSAITLTMSQSLTVAGTMTVTGMITFASGKAFTISAGGTVTWNPSTSTSATATLFTNGVESFATTSTLIINKWYDQTNVPLGSVVTGNFGNLTISLTNTTEWKQQNYFQSHQIVGTLTITYGYITLDKSGAITNTTIGNINLTTSSAYLDFHSGTHPSSFTVNTTNLTVTDGTLEGLLNGNGNITVNVTGNATVSGLGYLYILRNTGTAGVGNGESVFNVTGNFSQSGSSSKFYGTYNATTFTAGNATMTVGGNLSFSGGTFMLHYACHVGTVTTSLTVNGNSTLNYLTTGNIFRITGLTILSSTNCTSKMNFKNGGSLTFTGVAGEFTSSSTTGVETDTIVGNMTVSGGWCGFNWPASTSQAHATTLVIGGNYSATAGSMAFSWFGQALTASIAGNATITGGSTWVKYEAGATTLAIGGYYNQSAGTFYGIGNLTSSATSGTTINLTGNFTLSGGTFNSSAYPGSTAAAGLATINLSNDFTYSGGTITETATTVGRGRFRFLKSGTVTVIGGGTISNTVDFYIPNTGTTVNLSTYVLTGSGDFIMSPSTGLMMGSTGGISTSGATGNVQVTGTRTYGTTSDYTYNGSAAQVTGIGLPATVNNLTVNNSAGVTLSQTVAVSNILTLTTGIVSTGSYEVNSTNTSTSGIVSQSLTDYINGNLRRSISGTGSYDFPVGTAANYEPMNMNMTGITGSTNLLVAFVNANPINASYPLTGVTVSGTPITDILNYGYWTLTPNSAMTGGDYTVTVSEKGHTNGVSNPQAYTVLTRDNSTSYWVATNGTHSNTTQSNDGTTVTAARAGLSPKFDYGIGFSSGGSLPIKLIYFTAKLNDGIVNLDWATAAEVNNNFFTVERSTDGENFEPLLTKPGAGNSTVNLYYNATDESPVSGYSYYRLKQTDFDGHYTYSNIETVKNGDGGEDGMSKMEIKSITPNPFVEKFKVSFMIKESVVVDFTLLNSSGQTVAQEKIQTEEGINTYEFIDKYNLKKGIYFVTLIYNDQKVIQKIIKN